MATAPGAVPVAGHALQLRKGPLAFLAGLPAHGDLVQVRIGPSRGFVVCHPDLVHQVLLNDRVFDKGGFFWDKVRLGVGNGLATCPYRDHRRQRRLLQPAFSRNRLRGYAPAMTEQINTLTGRWRDGEVIDVIAQMNTLTSHTTSRTLFIADCVAPAAAAVVEALPDFLHGIYRQMMMPALLNRLPTPANRRFDRARTRLRTSVTDAVHAYRQDGDQHEDLLSVLLAARDQDGSPLTDSEIYDQVISLLIGGTETTATTLAWALHLLATHPHIQQRLHAETSTLLGHRPATWDDLPRLELTGHVITETLRLYPAGWLFTRITSTDTELAGQPLPAGTTLICSPYLIQRRADTFPDPERFDPDRWRAGHAPHPPRQASIPFGAGARKCIGDTFAMTLAPLALATIIARWRVEPATDAPVRPSVTATLQPESLRLRLHQRTRT
ncbi:cytochrome P450 [Streptomyces albireticuli]|uniref:Cytochrome P450 n=1 Tax=Streptomyces albireticuli TaxID=1940 RepID=A0A1Z2LBN9_9ACTN|nr:cytochrome P450 [Streptomyces albireticuli]